MFFGFSTLQNDVHLYFENLSQKQFFFLSGMDKRIIPNLAVLSKIANEHLYFLILNDNFYTNLNTHIGNFFFFSCLKHALQ